MQCQNLAVVEFSVKKSIIITEKYWKSLFFKNVKCVFYLKFFYLIWTRVLWIIFLVLTAINIHKKPNLIIGIYKNLELTSYLWWRIEGFSSGIRNRTGMSPLITFTQHCSIITASAVRQKKERKKYQASSLERKK